MVDARCDPPRARRALRRCAKKNFVDHSLSDQSSVLRFIEDNWSTGRGGAFDALARTLSNMFDFSVHESGERRLLLDPATGQPQQSEDE